MAEATENSKKKWERPPRYMGVIRSFNYDRGFGFVQCYEDAMVELFADKHVFGKSNNADVDPSKYIDISPLSLVNVTEEQIDNYKKEILTDNEVYTYDVR